MHRVFLLAAAAAAALVLAAPAWAPPRYANLALSVTARPTAFDGQAIRFSWLVHNRGPDSALDVFVRHRLPAGTTVLAVRPSQGTCSGTVDVECALGLMGHANRGNDAKATVEVLALADRSGLAASADVRSPSLAMDPVPDNDRAEAAVDVVPLTGPRPAADLVVDVRAPATAKVKRRFAYTVRVLNLGPDRAEEVRVGGRSVGGLGLGQARTVRVLVVPRRRGALRVAAAATVATRELAPADNRASSVVRVR